MFSQNFLNPLLFVFKNFEVPFFLDFPVYEAREQLSDSIHHFVFEYVIWPFNYCYVGSSFISVIFFKQPDAFWPYSVRYWTFVQQVVYSFIVIFTKATSWRTQNYRTCILSHVRMWHLRMTQLKSAILGHHIPPQNFPHLTSFSNLWVSINNPMASLILNLPRLEYPHHILSEASFHGVFLEQSSM